MSFENPSSFTPEDTTASNIVKRGAVDPTLPQNDTIEERAERRDQIAATCTQYQWTTDIPTLPGVPLSAQMPKDDDPSIEWWLHVLAVGLTIIENIAAVYTQPIFKGLDEAGKEIIEQALTNAKSISDSVSALREKHSAPSGLSDLEAGINHAEQETDIALLKGHDSEIRDIVEVIVDVLKAIDMADTRSIDAYRDQYQIISTPGIAYTFQNDEEFGRLRVAGPNPMLIKNIKQLPDNFPVSVDQYAAAMAGDNLTDALDDGRVFLCDYAPLEVLIPGVWKGHAKYVYQPLALFAVPPGGSSLKPVAIQCGQDSNQFPIMTPSVSATEKWGWEVAKFVVQVADCNYHELFVHLAGTHLVSEAIAVATRRHLAEVHPLWSLLVPHFEGTLFINNLAVETLINKGGPIDAFFGGTITSSQMTAVKARLSFNFQDKMLPNEMAARGVNNPTKLLDYPYRDDALLVWNAIHEWAKQYIHIYYADDDAVTGDTELALWATAIAAEGHMEGFSAITSRAQLVDVCTMIIFTASAQHAAVNFPQKDIMTFAPAVTGAGWNAAPAKQEGQDKQQWLDHMPPVSLALEQLSSLFLLGSVYYRPLGEYQTNRAPYRHWFRDPVITDDEGPLSRFQAALRAVEAQIIARNEERMHPYTYLQPSLIPTSTNI